MKPHEETWRAIEVTVVYDDESALDLSEFNVRRQENGSQNAARARLAAQAPAMARLLLEIQWSGASGYENVDACPACGPNDEHASDCKLVAVLRDAGVLP